MKHLNQGVENLRRTNILEIIIDHLITMTEKAMEFRVLYLAKTFLIHARRLCKFYHNYGCDMGAREYLTTIGSIEEEISGLQMNEDFTNLPPTLPIRTSTKEVFEHLESVRRTVRVDIEVTHSKRENSPVTVNRKNNRKSVEQSVEQAHSYNENIELIDSLTPNLSRRKSIKFTGNVVEVHEGDTNPIQKPEGQSLVSILRFNPDVTEINDAITIAERDKRDVSYESYESFDNYGFDDDVDENSRNDAFVSSKEINKSQAEGEGEGAETTDSPCASAVKMPSDERILGGFSKRVGMLRNLTRGHSQVIKDITASTEKLFISMASEETRLQLKEVIKRKTFQLKGAFNQCSES